MTRKPAKRTVKDRTAWAIILPSGKIGNIIDSQKKWCRVALCNHLGDDMGWPYYERKGYRCVPVVISEVKR